MPLRHYHRKLDAGFVALPQMTGRRFGMPFILSPPTLTLRFRQNNGPTPSGDYQPSRSLSMAGSEGSVEIPGFLFKSPFSEVSASSRLDIKPDTSISGNIAILPESFFNASEYLSDSCANRSIENTNSFVMNGRGGFPLSPGKLAPSTFMDYSPTTSPSQQNINNNYLEFSNDSVSLSSQQIDCIF